MTNNIQTFGLQLKYGGLQRPPQARPRRSRLVGGPAEKVGVPGPPGPPPPVIQPLLSRLTFTIGTQLDVIATHDWLCLKCRPLHTTTSIVSHTNRCHTIIVETDNGIHHLKFWWMCFFGLDSCAFYQVLNILTKFGDVWSNGIEMAIILRDSRWRHPPSMSNGSIWGSWFGNTAAK